MQIMSEPHLYRPSMQLVTRRQLNQRPARRWTNEMGVSLTISRKTWERVFVLQSLYSRGCLGAGRRGLGFGVGADPMIPVMVKHGCELVATDYGESEHEGWGPGLDLDPKNIAGHEAMSRQVTTLDVDMNDIPSDLRDFDFVYSCGSLEHIGGAANGLEFVENAMSCLRPGGFAVHTTELNLSGGTETLDVPNLSFYLPSSVDALLERLASAGHNVSPMNYYSGSRSEDLHLANRPYAPPCLKILHSGFRVTSMGFVIQAAQSGRSRLPIRPTVRALTDVATDASRAVGRRVGAAATARLRRR